MIIKQSFAGPFYFLLNDNQFSYASQEKNVGSRYSWRHIKTHSYFMEYELYLQEPGIIINIHAATVIVHLMKLMYQNLKMQIEMA